MNEPIMMLVILRGFLSLAKPLDNVRDENGNPIWVVRDEVGLDLYPYHPFPAGLSVGHYKKEKP